MSFIYNFLIKLSIKYSMTLIVLNYKECFLSVAQLVAISRVKVQMGWA